MAGKDDGDDGSSSVMSGSYVIEGGRTTSNFPSTAALAWTTTAAEGLMGGLNRRYWTTYQDACLGASAEAVRGYEGNDEQ